MVPGARLYEQLVSSQEKNLFTLPALQLIYNRFPLLQQETVWCDANSARTCEPESNQATSATRAAHTPESPSTMDAKEAENNNNNDDNKHCLAADA